MVGAAAGGAISLLTTPLVGAPAGTAITQALTRAGEELDSRVLAPRQHLRVGAVYALALDEVRARIVAGDEIRDDRFFEAQGETRCTGEEILEGVLLRAGDAYEEQKLKYLAHLYASLVFDSAVNPEYAYLLLRTAGELTYRQYTFLAHFGGDNPPLPDIPASEAESMLGTVRAEGSALGAEIADLGARGLLVVNAGGQMGSLTATFDAQAIIHFKTGLISATKTGKDLHRLMRLDLLPQAEVDILFDALIAGG